MTADERKATLDTARAQIDRVIAISSAGLIELGFSGRLRVFMLASEVPLLDACGSDEQIGEFIAEVRSFVAKVAPGGEVLS